MNPEPIFYPKLGFSESITTTFRSSLFYQYGPDNNRNISQN